MRNASNALLNLLPLIVLITVILATGCTSPVTMRLRAYVYPEVAAPVGKKVAVEPETVWIDADALTLVSADSLAKLTRFSFDGQVSYSGIWEHYDACSIEFARQLDSLGFTVVDSAADADVVFTLRGHRAAGGSMSKFPRDMNNIDHRYWMETAAASISIRAYLPTPDSPSDASNAFWGPRHNYLWCADIQAPSGAIVEQEFPTLIRAMLSAYGKKVEEIIPVELHPEPKRSE